MTNYVILYQDGAVDELVSMLMLTAMPDIGFVGTEIVNGDCLAQPTAELSAKLLDLASSSAEVVVSPARGWNQFPWIYRQYALQAALLPIVNRGGSGNHQRLITKTGWVDQLRRQADAAGDDFKFTLLSLGPLTPISDGLKANPDAGDLISEIVWMGGVYTPAGQSGLPVGNVDTGIAPGANPNAEWNAYWDPWAVDTVWQSGIPFVLFPLNVTNKVILTPEILRKWFFPVAADYPVIDFAAQMYAMVAFQAGYSFWDTVTTAYLGAPGLFTIEQMAMSVDTSDDPTKQGTMTAGSGATLSVATDVNVEGFYGYLIETLKAVKFPTS